MDTPSIDPAAEAARERFRDRHSGRFGEQPKAEAPAPDIAAADGTIDPTDSATWPPDFTAQVRRHADTLVTRLRASRIDPETLMCGTGDGFDPAREDLCNQPYQAWTLEQRIALEELAAHDLLGVTTDDPSYDIPSEGSVAEDKLEAAQLAKLLEAADYRIEPYWEYGKAAAPGAAPDGLRWVHAPSGDIDTPFGMFAEVTATDRTFWVRDRRLFTVEDGEAYYFWPTTHGDRGATFHPSLGQVWFDTQDDLDGIPAGDWAELGFGMDRPCEIDMTSVRYNPHRPTSSGPVLITQEGFVQYNGDPTPQEMERDQVVKVTGGDRRAGWRYRKKDARDRYWHLFDEFRTRRFNHAGEAIKEAARKAIEQGRQDRDEALRFGIE